MTNFLLDFEWDLVDLDTIFFYIITNLVNKLDFIDFE